MSVNDSSSATALLLLSANTLYNQPLGYFRVSHVYSFLSIVAGLFLLSTFYRAFRRKNTIPMVNAPRFWEPRLLVQLSFLFNARKLVSKGLKLNRAFRILTDIGVITVVPSEFANEIRTDSRLSYPQVITENFHARFPGFEGFREGTTDAALSRDIARKHLTHSLGIKMLICCRNDYWTEINLREHVLKLVARLSSRVFLGEEITRNDDWIKVTTEYTTDAYIAAKILRLWPAKLRPLVHWILPCCIKLRRHVTKARSIIIAAIERRRLVKEAAIKSGKPIPTFNDVIEWLEQDTKDTTSDYDPVVAQLILSQAAIHTTTDLLTQAILEVAATPEIVEPLRDEINDAVDRLGWSKAAFHEMKLLDSVLKESQRRKPLAMTFMHRLVLEDTTLSNGDTIPKGSVIGVSADKLWDPNVHENPERFDGYRFVRMRESGDSKVANQAHLVSTSPNHLAFGYGKHACAGRFFAAHESKMALSNILRRYDWKLAPVSANEKPLEFGLVLVANPKARISMRLRQRS
ncbi:cytochrome P450 [Colletotrichum scovillei]|uniref:Cytochrome P450 n=1 Tax=Colletotrichum scovillei TaxID=1209932 RepID=A0A9P7QYD5_9PEZI|nr:cytochrome P450 [Colletotrichum scovillei]KAG7046370.1 cytochrome P450 [Colletotrichum scovillei]KAG7063719.1 cytochrome P450 [Colletotrichum scovillei]